MSQKYHIAKSGKQAGKYVACHAEKACRNGGKHIDQTAYNKLSKINNIDDIFTLVEKDNSAIEPQWSINEKYIASRIAENLPEGFSAVRMGSADSTVSDIAIYNPNGELVTFVEAKSEKSQCGQFVLTENENGRLEATSGLDNPYTSLLTETLNRYRETYPDDTKINPSNLTEEEKGQVYSWIKHHYENMGASFIAVTDNNNTYVNIIPLDKMSNEVIATLNFPRAKQSGSANLPKSHKETFASALKISKISNFSYNLYERDGKTFIETHQNILSIDEQYVDKDNYFLSKISEKGSGAVYVAKKRSNTKNINEVLGFEYKGDKKDSGFDFLNKTLQK